MKPDFMLYTAICAIVGALGIYFATKNHRH